MMRETVSSIARESPAMVAISSRADVHDGNLSSYLDQVVVSGGLLPLVI